MRWFARLYLVAGMVLVVSLLAPVTASGQNAVAVGAFVGREFDLSDDWLFFGGQGWLGLAGKSVVINPRLSILPFQGGSTLQLDGNVLWDLGSVRGKVKPYLGGGLAFIRDGYDPPAESESKFGVSFVAGLRLALASARLSPFLHSQYTTAKDYPNRYTISAGVNYLLKSK